MNFLPVRRENSAQRFLLPNMRSVCNLDEIPCRFRPVHRQVDFPVQEAN